MTARNPIRAIATLFVAAVLLLTGQAANASPLANNTSTSAAHFAGDPLAGRFGSTQADFEDAYGDPLDEESPRQPFGAAYAVSDFGGGTAYAYFDDDRLIYLTFVPDDGFKAMIEILDILETFLPSDYANGWMGDETSESFVVNVQSADLAAVVGKEVYEKYDAGMWVGDLHAFALGTRDGDLTSIEFGLGWGAQEFNPSNATEDEGDEYLSTLTASFETLNDSIDRFYAVITGPTFGDAESTNELIDIFATWNSAYRDAQYLTPPSGYEEIHEAYLGFTGALVAAASDITWGNMDTATAEFAVAQEQAEILVDLLEETSTPAIFDVKSGHARP